MKRKELRALTARELAVCAALGAAGGAFLGWIFYRRFWVILLAAAAGGVLFPLLGRTELAEREKRKKEEELKELLRRFSTALRSGLSLENALFRVIKNDEETLFPLLGPAWGKMCTLVGNRQPPELALSVFALESGLEEMKQLAAVAEICRREGGSLSQAVAESAELLREKAEIRAETRLLLTRKRTEQRVLNVMPFAMLALLSSMSPGYFDVMYSSPSGILLMSICLAVMGLSVFLSKKMSDPGELR